MTLHSFHAPADVWQAARDRATAEGTTVSAVQVAALAAYTGQAPSAASPPPAPPPTRVGGERPPSPPRPAQRHRPARQRPAPRPAPVLGPGGDGEAEPCRHPVSERDGDTGTCTACGSSDID